MMGFAEENPLILAEITIEQSLKRAGIELEFDMVKTSVLP